MLGRVTIESFVFETAYSWMAFFMKLAPNEGSFSWLVGFDICYLTAPWDIRFFKSCSLLYAFTSSFLL